MASRTQHPRVWDFTHGSLCDWSKVSAKCYSLRAAGSASRISYAAMAGVDGTLVTPDIGGVCPRAGTGMAPSLRS